MFVTSYLFLIISVAYSNGQCQDPGNAICWVAAYDLIVGDPCCPGSECFPWLGNYGNSSDNWCQFVEPIQEGHLCGNRVGLCDVGLTCISDVCVSGTTSSPGQCQDPGNALCWVAAYDQIIGDPCCTGSECFPWLGNYGDSSDNWCQYIEPIEEGQFCGNRVGLCDVGLICTGWPLHCVMDTVTTTSTTAEPSTSTSGGSCQQPGSPPDGAKCSYVLEGMDHDFGLPCCPGSECLAYDTPALEPYFKYCMKPEDLQEGDICANKVGKCGIGLICEEGVCKPETSLGCQTPGKALCRILDGWQDIGAPCCAGSECLPWTYGQPHNFYCQKTGLGVGEFCGDKIGQCDIGLDCILDICSTPSTTSPTDSPVTCSEPGMVGSGGSICFFMGVHMDCCPGSICNFYPASSPDDFNIMYCQYRDPIASGEPCTDKQGTCIGGEKCDPTGVCP